MTEENLFHDALAKPAAERAVFLEQACTGQPQLRAAVVAMLAAHEAYGGLPDRPSEGAPLVTGEFTPQPEEAASLSIATADDRPNAEPGAVIAGRYVLQEKIGEGGMGEVWVAKQTEPVKRRVALKLIKTGMDSKAVLARFEQERQALALMDHPNIARVLDGGIVGESKRQSGRVEVPETEPFARLGAPFFVMELVNGLPLTKFCDEAKLTPRQRLELFVPICQAVQHAHQKGIVHRDLKPANILVTLIDSKPIPKVIDFGVAKATGGKLTDESMSTQFGAVVGTLEYMSPEQAGFSGADVDTRADIYSLGVILYELLTGLRPIDAKRLKKAAYSEMIRIIQEEDPSKPSTRLSTDESLPSLAALRQTEPRKLMALLRGELDWVVMKCLEKQRERRYETANALGRDLQRYLADEPVEARPPSAGYRMSKFLKRNKGPVVAACLVLMALLAGMVGTTIGLLRAKTAEGVAQKRFEEAESARAKAAASAIAEAEERRKAEQAEADTLADYRASTDDAILQLIGSKPELGPQERTYLENALKRWQAFAARKGDDERSRAIRGEGHFSVASLWQNLGRNEEARTEYLIARDVWTKLVEQFPAVPKHQQNLAKTHNNLGILLSKLGKGEEARVEYQAARDIQKKLVEQFPAVPAYQHGLAMTHHNLGEYQAARDIQKKLVEQFPAVPEYQLHLASTHNNLGILLANLGKQEEALPEYRAARDIQKKLVEQFPAVPAYQHGLAMTHHNLGVRYFELGKGEEARAEYWAARDLQKKLVEQFPAVPGYRQKLARTHNHLGSLRDDQGRRERARLEYQAARDLLKVLVEQFPTVPEYQADLARTHNNLGVLLKDQGKQEEARVEYQAARDLKKKLVERVPSVPKYQQELAGTHNNLGLLLAALGKPEDARAEYRAAGSIQKKLVEQFPAMSEYRQELAGTHNNLGILLTDQRKREEARAEYQAARDIEKKLVEQFPAVSKYRINLGASYCNYGILIRNEGKPAESLEWFHLAIQCLQPIYDKEPRNVTAKRFLCNSYWGRADAYDRLQKPAAAIKDWEKVIELGSNDQLALGNCRLASALIRQGNGVDAERAFARGLDLREQAAKTAGPNAREPAWLLATYLMDVGLEYGRVERHAQAVEWFGRAGRELAAFEKKWPGTEVTYQLRWAHQNRASALSRQKRYPEAVNDWARALELCPKEEKLACRVSQAYFCAFGGDIADALTQAAELTIMQKFTADQWLDLACIYALASGKVANRKQEFANRAMEMLRKAVEAGYSDAAHLAKDPDLNPLRGREDFKKLLTELGKKPPPR